MAERIRFGEGIIVGDLVKIEHFEPQARAHKLLEGALEDELFVPRRVERLLLNGGLEHLAAGVKQDVGIGAATSAAPVLVDFSAGLVGDHELLPAQEPHLEGPVASHAGSDGGVRPAERLGLVRLIGIVALVVPPVLLVLLRAAVVPTFTSVTREAGEGPCGGLRRANHLAREQLDQGGDGARARDCISIGRGEGHLRDRRRRLLLRRGRAVLDQVDEWRDAARLCND